MLGKSSVFSVSFLLLMSVWANAANAVPEGVAYVGELAGPSGVPLNQTVSVTVDIFPAEMGGTPLYTEDLGSVLVVFGRFDIVIG